MNKVICNINAKPTLSRTVLDICVNETTAGYIEMSPFEPRLQFDFRHLPTGFRTFGCVTRREGTNSLTVAHTVCYENRSLALSVACPCIMQQTNKCKPLDYIARYHIYCYSPEAGIAQWVYGNATGWTVRGSIPGGCEIFRTRPDRPWGVPSLLYNGYRVPGVKGGRGVRLTTHPI